MPPAHIPRCSVSDIFSEMIDRLNPPFGVDFLYIKVSFLPSALIPQGLKKRLQQGAAFRFQKPCLYLGAVVEGQSEEIDDGGTATGLGIGSTIDHPGDPGVDDSAGAHGTGLQGHIEGALPQPPAAQRAAGLADGLDFRVRQGGFSHLRRRLRPRPTTRSPRVMTQPTGTSPSAPASSANESARRIMASSNEIPPILSTMILERGGRVKQKMPRRNSGAETEVGFR